MSKKYVYMFTEGNGTMRNLLGGKGANLAEMINLGMPVPNGFTVTTEACTKYYDDGKMISDEIKAEILESLAKLEADTGKTLGDPSNPLLLAVRSGARASMPGMMDTVLNLGMNDEVVKGVATKTGNERFAYDSYRRFIQMFSDVVMDVSKHGFETIIDEMKAEKGVKLDTDFTAEDLKEMVERFKAHYKAKKGEEFPSEPKAHLLGSVTAVFRSWDNERANIYRRMHGIPYSWGTAVNVQAMVFGNYGDDSGSGVAFSRNPATGEDVLYGEFLVNAQGEDVVAGIRTAPALEEGLKVNMPKMYEEFYAHAKTLEKHYKDMQDMEFTVENGKLYMLQTRNGKRTATAAIKIAEDLVQEGMISEEEAVLRVDPKQLDALLHPQFDGAAEKAATPIGKALPASPGAACGQAVFTAKDAKNWTDAGKDVILVRLETSPEDIEGMDSAKGILTVRGGMTSHAAVVARGMGKCCVSGCGEIVLDEKAKQFTLGGKVIKEGDWISLNGSLGTIYGEKLPTIEPVIEGSFLSYMSRADKFRKLKVRTNADSPADSLKAKEFGAEGIGLCRTEHMFFEKDRIKSMREMIVAKTEEARKVALDKLLPHQQKDFEGIFEAMAGLPVTIRLLDPPLHEFLPTEESDINELAKDLGMTATELKAVIESLHEFNPMMGHRGLRLAVSYPEIAVMQTTAIINAAIAVNKKGGSVVPEIMIPLSGDKTELKYVADICKATAEDLIKAAAVSLEYMVGTMIEIPRAALTADEIAGEAEFFSFGTNDLTQMTFGFSRDDAGKFLEHYYDKKIYEFDPFATLDQTGVGQLVKMAAEKGRAARPGIKLGICGEHGGDPASVGFCHEVGLDYVSCSPFRVPIARLAAAQAAILEKRGETINFG